MDYGELVTARRRNQGAGGWYFSRKNVLILPLVTERLKFPCWSKLVGERDMEFVKFWRESDSCREKAPAMSEEGDGVTRRFTVVPPEKPRISTFRREAGFVGLVPK